MKLIMEGWRQYLKEVRFVDPPAGKPILDITGKGSNELGSRHVPWTAAWKIFNNIVTPCTSSAECDDLCAPGVWDPMRKDCADQPQKPTEDWSDEPKMSVSYEQWSEEYEQWSQKNEEAIGKADFDINQFLAVKKYSPNPERWENFFDEQWAHGARALEEGDWIGADNALRQIQMLLDRQADMSDPPASKSSWSTPEQHDQWLWDNRWPPEND